MQAFRFCVLVVLICGLIGCGGSKRVLPDRNLVSGNVTLDGESLKQGSITFVSIDDIASGLVASANIIDGHYEVQVTPGEKNVEINCFMKVPGGSEIEGEYAEFIPEKYNSKTTLQATVGGEKSEFDFDLKAK